MNLTIWLQIWLLHPVKTQPLLGNMEKNINKKYRIFFKILTRFVFLLPLI